MAKCIHPNKNGGPCSGNILDAEASACLWHSPRPDLIERRQQMVKAGGAKGRATQLESKRKAREAGHRTATDVDVETSKGRLAEIVRLLLSVEQSSGSATGKATAITRLVSEARAEVRGVELEEAYAEMRTAVLNARPDLANLFPARLKAVR